MSSTNRGSNRRHLDTYFTPQWCVDSFFNACQQPVESFGDQWLEPSAGRGHIIKASRFHTHASAVWSAFEVQTRFAHDLRNLVGEERLVIGDFLRRTNDLGFFDVIMGNPPNRWALDFIKASMLISKHVIFLLPLGFLGSRHRNEWWHENKPRCVYVLPHKPSFTGFGSDSSDYAWIHWDMSRWGSTKLVICPSVDKHVIQSQKKEMRGVD